MNRYIRSVVVIALGLGLLYFVSERLDVKALNPDELSFKKSALIPGILFYLLAHVAKAYRIFLLSSSRLHGGLFKAVSIQLETNALNLLLPFKLGEGYRFFRISKGLQVSPSNSLYIFIAEKTLDLIILFLFLSMGLLLSDTISIQDLKYTFFIFASCIAFIIGLFVITEKLLGSIQLSIFNKDLKSAIWSIIRKLTYNFHKAFIGVKRVLVINTKELLVLSCIIWFFELLSFVVIIDFLEYSIIPIIFLCVFVSLSWLLPNGSLGLGGVQLAFYQVAVLFGFKDFAENSLVYSVSIYAPAILIGLLIVLRRYIVKIKTNYENSN